MTDKDSVLILLQEYGDSISNHDTPLPTLLTNLKFLQKYGSKDNHSERALLAKNLPSNYKLLMTEPIENLRKRHTNHQQLLQKKQIIEFLLKFGYKENYLRKKKYQSLLKLQNDPKLYDKYSRKELVSVICNDYGISPKTARNWNLDKTREFLKKNYCKKKDNIQEYLRGLSNSLFCDIVARSSSLHTPCNTP